MRLAIVGNSGYIAGYLLEFLSKQKDISDIITIGRNKKAGYILDLECPERFDYSVLQKVDFVLFTAAVSSPDQCAQDYEICWKINVEGTCSFIRSAMDRGCKILFFSSDAVYGDLPGKIYLESMMTNAKTPYGKMKKAVEDTFQNEYLFKALRLSYVVSAKDRFVSYCLECIRQDETAEIFHPFYRNCITLNHVGNIVIWLVRNWDIFPHAFLNGVGEELVSRVRIADEINRLVNGKMKYKIIYPKQAFYLNRPQITQIESMYLNRYHILERISFTQAFQKELEGHINEEWKK